MNRNRMLLSLFFVFLSIWCAAQTTRQKQSSPLNPTEPPKTEEGMVAFLLPDAVAYPDRLKDVSHEVAVQALTKAQREAAGSRADGIAYLLVILGHEPEANHQLLFEALRSCVRDSETCDDHLISYMSDLFIRNDKTVLVPLLDASKTTDPAIAEVLGSSYQDMLAHDTRSVMAEISRRSAKDQRRLCHMIATGEGGGFPDESIANVTASLEEVSRSAGPSATAAMMCLSEIRAFVPR